MWLNGKVLSLVCIGLTLAAQLQLLRFCNKVALAFSQWISGVHGELSLSTVIAIELFGRFSYVPFIVLMLISGIATVKVLKTSPEKSGALWLILQIALGMFFMSILTWGILGVTDSTLFNDAKTFIRPR